ncbi:hypothetical protein [Sporomusa sphaeroides]|nr:hypothetical protein [Sporomusa sphaeroides]
MSHPAVSYHLQALKHVGIVIDSRKGKWIYYGSIWMWLSI